MISILNLDYCQITVSSTDAVEVIVCTRVVTGCINTKHQAMTGTGGEK